LGWRLICLAGLTVEDEVEALIEDFFVAGKTLTFKAGGRVLDCVFATRFTIIVRCVKEAILLANVGLGQ
jgi:hypothetical protein